jgi:hypothetical protein
MGVKFRMEFTNAQDTLCVVKFDFSNYNDDAILLFGGPRPFVLQEFNSDEDLFKPVRPMQATIEVLASAAGVDLEDFLTDDDQTVKVRFDFGQYEDYWVGYLSQEDIQETWIATNHILTLRADDGIGALKTMPLADGENQITGTYSPYDFIKYAMSNTAVDFLNARICSNLFHTSMTFAANQTGIDQCTIDARTFEQAPGEFDDSYTVVEKINRSWSQTIFQWWGDWFIMRLEELFVPTTTNLVGFQLNKPMIGQRASISRRWDINVGVDELVKPIMPEMLKTIQKPSKETTIKYDYDKFNQTLCNESFESGTFSGSGTITLYGETIDFDAYTVDDWDHFAGFITSATPSTKGFVRTRLFVNNKFIDDYIEIEPETAGDGFIRSCEVFMEAGDSVNISFEHKWPSNISGSYTEELCYVVLTGDNGTTYSLDNSGKWRTVVAGVYFFLSYSGNNDGNSWNIKEVESESAPTSGSVYVYLFVDRNIGGSQNKQYKDLKFEIVPLLLKTTRRNIRGDYDRYTIQRNIVKNYEETIFLDDFESRYYKGAITESDGETLTGDEWFRRPYPFERYTFKRHHAIARWWMNRNYKARLECNFYGLEWGTSGNTLPIGLMNTVKFVDDAPTKVFAIVNLREIDFMSATWAANLIEVYDSQIEGDVPGDTDVHSFDFYYE